MRGHGTVIVQVGLHDNGTAAAVGDIHQALSLQFCIMSTVHFHAPYTDNFTVALALKR